MILADKIIEERKRCGLSQEELADRLSVSRQSVSKWESAQATPDLQKILRLAEIFGVSTDYLLKDDMESPAHTEEGTADAATPLRRVSLEEANQYLDAKQKESRILSIATMLCIQSPVLLVFLAGLSSTSMWRIGEGAAVAIGMAWLFSLVAAGVFLFILQAGRSKPFESLEKEPFETAYGVTGLVREKKKAHDGIFARGIAIGVSLCIVAVLPLITAGAMGASGVVLTSLTALLILIVSAGVNLIIRVSVVNSGLDILLQEGEFSVPEKKAKGAIELVGSVYWCIITAIYLGWSFLSFRWQLTWVVWPVAGVLFGAVSAVVRLFSQKEK